MRKVAAIAGAVVTAVLAWPGAVSAEHMTLVGPSGELRAPAPESTPESAPAREPDRTREPAGSSTLDLDLKVDKDGFRLGGRLLGPSGRSGAGLNGRMRPNGFALDGRVENEAGRAYNFRLNADVLDLVVGSPWRMPFGIPKPSVPVPEAPQTP
jgi:hypothetical protein